MHLHALQLDPPSAARGSGTTERQRITILASEDRNPNITTPLGVTENEEARYGSNLHPV